MSLFFESIKLENGNFYLLDLHQKRMQNTVKNVFKKDVAFDLENELLKNDIEKEGLFKVKVIYDLAIKNIIIEPYSIKDHAKVVFLHREQINYTYKNIIRKSLDYNKKASDDAIFVINDSLTDSSYGNLALFDGSEWFTPKKCLLKGVKREYLFNTNKLKIKDIKLSEIMQYSRIAFVNAMRDFEKTYTFVVEGDTLLLEPFNFSK
jgi:4-amino-4-deoxychorismate lyase